MIKNQLILTYSLSWKVSMEYPHRVKQLVLYLREHEINHVYEPSEYEKHIQIFMNAFDPAIEQAWHEIRKQIISMIKTEYHEGSIELLYWDIGT